MECAAGRIEKAEVADALEGRHGAIGLDAAEANFLPVRGDEVIGDRGRIPIWVAVGEALSAS